MTNEKNTLIVYYNNGRMEVQTDVISVIETQRSLKVKLDWGIDQTATDYYGLDMVSDYVYVHMTDENQSRHVELANQIYNDFKEGVQ